jgi:hypothetical protein
VANEYPNRLFVFLQRVLAPARLEGDVLLVHENIDQVKEPRKAWVYNAGPAPRAPGAEHRLRRSGHGLGWPAHRR